MDIVTLRRKIDRRPWMVAPFLVLWIAVSGLFVLGGGDVEGLLHAAFDRHAMPDAFNGLNAVASSVLVGLGLWTSLGLAAAWRRRGEVVVILLIGVGFVLALFLVGERWSDPNWHNVACVLTICCFVSTLVGGCWWCLDLWRRWESTPARSSSDSSNMP
ncbi:hypothetical protein [Paludisphaera soli]|uniref:hypothetical protein n=1 Tax=Paludisphaera soli TaxID=2712865 RepID=UPI0013EBD6DF|nr:hypothetical protein [Paludisphaera soli]